MNLFASDEFRDAVAAVYFPNQTVTSGLYRVDGRTFRLIEVDGAPIWSQSFLDYHDFLTEEEVEELGEGKPLDFMGAATWKKIEIGDWKEHFLPQDDPHSIPPRLHPSGKPFQCAPTVEWAGFDDHDAYLKYLRSKSSLVRNDQRLMRRMHELPGGIQYEADDRGDDVLDFCFETKSAQTMETLGVDLFGIPENKEFFFELRRRNMLLASTLRNDGRILAAWLGNIHNGSWTGWIYAHRNDPDLRKLSVGRQLLYFMLKDCHERGLREFDFAIGDEEYKYYFSTHARVIGPLGQPPFADRARETVKSAVKDVLHNQVFERAPWIEESANKALQKIRSRRWERTGRL